MGVATLHNAACQHPGQPFYISGSKLNFLLNFEFMVLL